MNNAVSELNLDELIKQVMLKLSEKNNEYQGVFDTMEYAILACANAQKKLLQLNLEKREEIIAAIRTVAIKNAEIFAKMAVEETKMGNEAHKISKNILAAQKTPGIEDLAVEASTGDHGLSLVELSPYGVIGAITPTTNPTETIICNAIGMISAGNGVVFSPHPNAHKVSLFAIDLLNKAITSCGGPKNLITAVINPSLESTKQMMNHKDVSMLVATGGPSVVEAVLKSGKKAIGAGAGNPPAVIDETADIKLAATSVIYGCSFDNNLPCVNEKEVIVVEAVANDLVFHMKACGAYFIEDDKLLKKLEALVLVNGKLNKQFVGKSAKTILEKLEIKCFDDVKVIAMEVSEDHPFVQHELMMPILPIVQAKNVEEAIDIAMRVEHGYRHTAIMHSKNIDNLSVFAKKIQTTVFVTNAPGYAGLGYGGQGYSSFTIAGPTGEGLTSAKNFSRKRRCVLVDGFNIR